MNILPVVLFLAAALLHRPNPLKTNRLSLSLTLSHAVSPSLSLSLARPTPQYAVQGCQDVLSAASEAPDAGLRRRCGHVTSVWRSSVAPPDDRLPSGDRLPPDNRLPSDRRRRSSTTHHRWTAGQFDDRQLDFLVARRDEGQRNRWILAAVDSSVLTKPENDDNTD